MKAKNVVKTIETVVFGAAFFTVITNPALLIGCGLVGAVLAARSDEDIFTGDQMSETPD
jgi:hypothetical protein